MLDASAAFDYLLDDGPSGDWVRQLLSGEEELAAPHLIDLELISALRRRVLRRELTVPRAREALSDFTEVALIRYPATDFLTSIWAMRSTLNPYDAVYVVLSEALAVPLATTDACLARSHGHRAEIIAP